MRSSGLLKKFCVLMPLFLIGCASLMTPDQPQKPSVTNSAITDKVTYDWWNSQIKISELKHNFTLDDEQVYWVGNLAGMSLFAGLTAHWIDPSGKEILHNPCQNKDFIHFYASMPVRNKISQDQQGQWTVEIRNADEELLDQQIFYIGRVQPKEEWTDPDYDLKQDEAIFLLKDIHAEVMDDFRTRTRIRVKLKILNEAGKKWAEIFIPVVTGVESLKINFAHTILPGGEIVPAKRGDFTVTMENYPNYIASQVYFIAMPAVEVGAIIEYDAELTTAFAPAQGIFSDVFGLDNIIPVCRFRYELVTPLEMPLKYKSTGYGSEPIIKQDPILKKKSYVWEARNIRPLVMELSMPPYRELGRWSVLSTADNWGKIADWWRELIVAKQTPDDKIKKLALDLTQGKITDYDKLRSIFEYIQQNIRYVGFTFGRTAYEPSPAAQTLENRYGDCKDKVVLLLALLKQAGVEAYSALVRTRPEGRLQTDISSEKEFDHVIVAAVIDGKYLFVDPTAESFDMDTLIYTDEDVNALIIKEDKWEFVKTPLSTAAQNKVETKVNLEVHPDLKMTGEMNVQWKGQENGLIRTALKIMKKEQHQEFVNQLVQGSYPYARMLSYKFLQEQDIHKPLELNVSFEIKNGITQAENMLVLRTFGDQGASMPTYLMQQRRHPIMQAYLRETKLDIAVVLADGLSVKKLPADFTFNTPFISSYIHYAKEGNRITQSQSIQVAKPMVWLDQIDQFKKDWDVVTQAHRQNIVLKR